MAPPREAQVLASLNHPNIAQIHGLEDNSSPHALVMELVDGEDLSEIIARGPIHSAAAARSLTLLQNWTETIRK